MISLRGIFSGLYSVLRPAQFHDNQENVTASSVPQGNMRLLPTQAPDQSPLRTKNKVVTSCRNEPLLLKARHIKSIEWQLILEGFDRAFHSWFRQSANLEDTSACAPDFTSYVDTISAGDPAELYYEKLARVVQIQFQLGKLSNEKYQAQMDVLEPFFTTLSLLKSPKAILHDLKEWLINLGFSENEEVIEAKAEDLATDLLLVNYTEDYFASINELKKEINQIGNLIFNIAYNDPDPKQRTLAILYRLRDALSQPAYKLACYDENNPLVSFLHQLSIASLTNSEVAQCYEMLGNDILLAENSDEHAKSTPLGTLVEKLRSIAIRAGIPQDDEQPQQPLVESLGFVMNQITASIPVDLAVSNGWKLYRAKSAPSIKDYRGFYENNPGKLYEERRGHVNNSVLITSSPAAGSNVAPEFSALLQSIENCNILRLASPFQRIAYSNLQDKKGGKEELQTKALMQLEDFYPLSIKCITVHQGSYKNQNKDKPFTAKQKELKLEELTADDNFMLVHKGKGAGYYFHPRDMERWKNASSKIVDLAYGYILKGNQRATDEEKYIAYSELVNLGIIRHHEQMEAKKIAHEATMLSIRSCGPACDRSVKVNMAMMSAMPRKEATERRVAAMGAGRSISAKGRVMTEERAVTEFGSLYKVLSSEMIRSFFDDIDTIDAKGNISHSKKSVRRNIKFTEENETDSLTA